MYEDIKLGGSETKAVLHAMVAPELNRKPEKITPRPAVIVCAGGAYAGYAWHEAEPVAKKFFGEGYNAFILDYTVKEAALYPRPLLDMSLAIIHVRTNAAKYHVDPEQIYVCGFSAGGHLCASIGALWHKDIAKPYPEMEFGLNKPNGLILGYPAIIPYRESVLGCFERIWGDAHPSKEYMAEYGILENISENMPRCYIWQTADDESVPVQNSLMLADKLTDFKIPYRMHIFQNGRHGLGLGNAEGSEDKDHKDVMEWFPEVIHWIRFHQ